MLDEPCKPGDDKTGKRNAEALAKKWRKELEDGEEGRAEREREEKERAVAEEVERAEREAREREEARRAAAEEKRRREGSGQPVARYVRAYIDGMANAWQPSTTSSHRKVLENQIAPYIGDVPMDELTPGAVDLWVTDLTRKHGYSPTTARKGLMLLKAAMKHACETDVLEKDPTRGVKAPKANKEQPNALDAAARGKVVAYINIEPTTPGNVGIRLALYTGMREGEICGLRWRNVDLDARTLRVCEAIGRASKGDIHGKGDTTGHSGLYVKTPKNAGSERVISYPAELADVLRARRAEMMRQCAEAGVRFAPDMYVIGGIDGRPMHHHYLWAQWSAAARLLGLVGTQGKSPTFHDLRHTYATTAIANGIDVKTVANSMGHKDAAMTLNTYAAPDPDAARRAADRMAEVYAEEERVVRERGKVLRFRPTGTQG